ncbi:MAG: DNA polymerase I [Lachnospiraceae bacterium]|nr:DNA polymerase I [Candidatus Colinaster equi]
MSKLLLIDGHSIINRAFYGVPELTNSNGTHVNAIYGFLNIMFSLMDEESPDYMCVAFDVKAPTFRHEQYSEYKGTRKPMPQELHEQVPILKSILQAMNITTFEHAGWEADDILGSLAKWGENRGLEVSLVSGDRDLLQIASDKIMICIPKTMGGKTITKRYHTQDVIDEYQVSPAGIIELKALMGDSADNIPGVPKVGAKTATQLLVTYGSVDGVYENLDKITAKALHTNLEENKDKAYLSKWLATIKTDCDTGLGLEELKIGDIYNEDAAKLLLSYELKSILKRFDKVKHTSVLTTDIVSEFCLATQIDECDRVYEEIAKRDIKLLAVCLITDGKEMTGVSVSFDDKTYVIVSRFFLTSDYIIDGLRKVMQGGSFDIVTWDIKSHYEVFDNIDMNRLHDALIESYLCNPLKSDYAVADVAMQYLDIPLRNAKDIFGKLSISDASISMEKEFKDFFGTTSYVVQKVHTLLADKIESLGMTKLYRQIEMPLSRVLYKCEREGVLVDKDKLQAFGTKISDEIAELEQSIYDAAGTQFNINSPKQLGEVLFEKLGLPGGKKTKSGFSTAADVLENLAEDYPIVNSVLRYRALAKLKGTYVDGLIGCIASDGRIHTTFNQTITATGRISSTEPNLQNIPVRTSEGKEIRKCFVPKEGYVFVDADYSQIELRLLAHMSEDKGLIEAYGMDADIHRITASKVFNIPFDEVTPERRRDAKAVNFGVVYGISSFGLSKDLGISKKEAASYIEDYFKTYPQVKNFLDTTVENAKNDGHVTTLYGRIRPIPELKNSNAMIRQFGERVAMNSPLQGTAADIMKLAMIEVDKALEKSGLDAKMLVQVHDELLLEVRKDQVAEASKILHDMMYNVAQLSVALEVDVNAGDNWCECH